MSSSFRSLVLVALLICFFIANNQASTASAQYFGTYFRHFPSYDNLNLTALNYDATSVEPDQAFHINQFSPLPDSAGFTPVPILIAPICIAYNASNVVGADSITFDISLETLGEWMMGTLANANTSLSPHTQHVPVGTAQFRLVLARNAATTRAVLQRMMEEKIPGFTSGTALPAQVLANPNIVWVADDFVAVDLLHSGDGSASYGLVTFISVAHGEYLPCASIIRTLSGGREQKVVYPISLADVDPGHFTIVPGTYNYTYSAEAAAASGTVVYPLFGTIFLSYPTSTTCADSRRSDVTIAFLARLYSSNIFFARLRKWGMLQPNVDIRTGILGNASKQLPCTTLKKVLAGGSDATDETMPVWILSYFEQSGVFVDYVSTDSTAGLQGILNRDIRAAGVDEPLAISVLDANPNLRVFPFVAFSVSIVFNVPGLNSFTVPLCAILKIFDGTITRWSDSRLQDFNPESALPDEGISIIVEGGEAGATQVFTRSLQEIDRRCNFQRSGSYTTAVQRSLTWNLAATQRQPSEKDAMNALRATTYSIGILTTPAALTDSTIKQAWVINETTKALSFPSSDLIAETLNLVTIRETRTGDVDRSQASNSENGYPIFGMSNMIFEDNQPRDNCSDVRRGLEFVMWGLVNDESRNIAQSVGFVQLPSRLSDNGRLKLIDAKCGGLYVFPQLRTNTSSFELSQGAIAGIAVGSFSFIVAIAILLVYFANRGKKSSKHAAKDSTVPMALIFTDIQSSTSLWSVAPQAMAASLDLHNDIIDSNIDKYSAYKVKTIGDAYMICVKDAKNAHELCLAIQRDLYYAEWPSDEIDMSYQDLFSQPDCAYQLFNFDGTERHALGDFRKKKSHVTDSELYKNRIDQSLFRGLAVRIGMTWGCAESREDPVTGAYDYYGATPCEASRCESIGNGGQTLYSGSMISALRDVGVDLTNTKHVAVTSLGKQPLKGIPAPVELYQVLPAEFAGRRFPPLRLDNDGGAMNHEIDTENTSSSNTTLDKTHTSSKRDTLHSHTTAPSTLASSGNSATVLAEEEADEKLPAEFRFARYLAKIDKVPPKIYVFIFDCIASILAATPREDKRIEFLKKIAQDWRISDIHTAIHKFFKKELGYEAYWSLRITQKIFGVIKVRQRKRDPEGEMNALVLTADVTTNSQRSTLHQGTLGGSIFSEHPQFPNQQQQQQLRTTITRSSQHHSIDAENPHSSHGSLSPHDANVYISSIVSQNNNNNQNGVPYFAGQASPINNNDGSSGNLSKGGTSNRGGVGINNNNSNGAGSRNGSQRAMEKYFPVTSRDDNNNNNNVDDIGVQQQQQLPHLPNNNSAGDRL